VKQSEVMELPPFLGTLETVPCHRCGEPFKRSADREHYYPPKVCSVQPSKNQIVICAERPWVDSRIEEARKRRISMHELIWYLSQHRKGSGA